MTDSPAARIAREYHHAWSSGDFEGALRYVADDIVCLASAGRLDGAAAFRSFMEPFSRITLGTQVLAVFGDDDTALIMYDTRTRPVPDAPGAECIRVADGRIVWMRIVFDRAPFDAARAAAG
jgi:ketosteroid isomerase-like protein